MNRRHFLYGGVSLLGLSVWGPALAIPAPGLNLQITLVDNAIDATRLLGYNRCERVFVLGLNPHKFSSFEDVRTYARDVYPQRLFHRARQVVELRQKMVGQFGADAVAAAMDWRTPLNDVDCTFRTVVRSSGWEKGFRYADYERPSDSDNVGFDDIYYGDLRPVIV